MLKACNFYFIMSGFKYSYWYWSHYNKDKVKSSTISRIIWLVVPCICTPPYKEVSSDVKVSAYNAGDLSPIPRSWRSPEEEIGCPLQYSWTSMVAQMVRIHLHCRRPGFDPWIGKIPWKREWLPTLVFLPGEIHGERDLVGYTVHGVAHSWRWLSD